MLDFTRIMNKYLVIQYSSEIDCQIEFYVNCQVNCIRGQALGTFKTGILKPHTKLCDKKSVLTCKIYYSDFQQYILLFYI